MENNYNQKYWGGNPKDFIDSISVNCVLFGFHDGIMKILLMKLAPYDKWMLPGGFVYKSEDLDSAANRVLETRTGLDNVELTQFHTFGKKNRTSVEENEELVKRIDIEHIDISWFLKRYVSIGYLAFLEYSKVDIIPDQVSQVEWCHIDEIPELYSDHNNMIKEAIRYIRKHLSTIPVGEGLLQEKFTMTELRTIYETILDKKLDRRNFQRKMLSTGYIIKLNEWSKKPGIKPSNLFTFDIAKYKEGYSGFE